MWQMKKRQHLLFMTGLKRSEIWINLGQRCLEGSRDMNPINAIVWICIFAFGITSILSLVQELRPDLNGTTGPIFRMGESNEAR